LGLHRARKRIHDADAQEIWRRGRWAPGTGVAAPKATNATLHRRSGRRWSRSRSWRHRRRRRRASVCSRSHVEAIRHAGRSVSRLDLIVTTAPFELEDLCVLGVLEDAREKALAQTFAIAAKKLERLTPQVARGDDAAAIA
jgi:hypothetical protein